MFRHDCQLYFGNNILAESNEGGDTDGDRAADEEVEGSSTPQSRGVL